MAKKDTTVTIDTKGQTEVECRIRMLTYMILFRSMNISQLRDGQIIQRIKNQITTEMGFSGDLAERRRRHMHTLLQKEQEKIKKWVWSLSLTLTYRAVLAREREQNVCQLTNLVSLYCQIKSLIDRDDVRIFILRCRYMCTVQLQLKMYFFYY